MRLQQALADRKFDPGPIDGDFGDQTEAAVQAFQTSAGLSHDGVAGPRTLAALGLDVAATGADVTGAVTVTMVRRMFPDTPVAHITANLPHILSELRTAGLGDRTMVLMALGTIRAETASFEPIAEEQSEFNTSPGGAPFDLYDDRADLGNRGAPDGAMFRGRGFVQITGRANYTKFSPLLGPGIDIVQDPGLARDPIIAARLLALFLGASQRAIRDAFADGDLAAARALVNGGHHGQDAFDDAVRAGEQVIPLT